MSSFHTVRGSLQQVGACGWIWSTDWWIKAQCSRSEQCSVGPNSKCPYRIWCQYAVGYVRSVYRPWYYTHSSTWREFSSAWELQYNGFSRSDVGFRAASEQLTLLRYFFNPVSTPDDAIFHNNANEANCKVENMASDSTETDEAVTKEEEYGLDTCAYSHISFFRSDQYSYEGKPTEPRTQYNSQTPYLDLSQVYGNSAAKIKFLRSFEVGCFFLQKSLAWLRKPNLQLS